MSKEEKDNLRCELEKLTGLRVKTDLLSANEGTFRIGGIFEHFFEPENPEQLQTAIQFLNENQQQIHILGAGSNILFNSSGVNAWTVRLGRGFKGLTPTADGLLRVGAAYSLTKLARDLSQDGYSGLEFAAGIPASLGGACRMNAGAHNGEMSDLIAWVQGFTASGELQRYSSKDLDFSYRRVTLPENFLITEVGLKLTPADRNTVMLALKTNLEYRKRTQPLSQPSVGSVFRNPGTNSLGENRSAGQVIEELGLKGRQIGSVMISDLHANWIVNPNKNGQSSDVLALISLCKQEARDRLSIDLQPEVVIW